MQKIIPNLWFNGNAEEAVDFYVSIFKNSRIGGVLRYGEVGKEIHGQPVGSVMTIEFALEGQEYLALNGGPDFKFTEAISFIINCETQDEVDYYWDRLTAGGDPAAQICGWLKDKFGVSWQVQPTIVNKLLADPDEAKRTRVMNAFMEMRKVDIAELEKAYKGQ